MDNEQINFNAQFAQFKSSAIGGWKLILDVPQVTPLNILSVLTILQNSNALVRITLEEVPKENGQVEPVKKATGGKARKAGQKKAD